MTRWSIVLSIVFALVVLSISAHAGSLSIVTVDEFPYGFLKKNRPTGMAFEIGNTIAREAGVTSTNILLPQARAVDALNHGEVDMALLPEGTAVGASVVNLGPVFTTRYVVIGRAGNYFQSLRELKGKTVAVVRGAEKNEFISKKSGIVPYPVNNYSQGMKLLLAQRVDAMAGIECGLESVLQQKRVPKQALGKPLSIVTTTFCLYVYGENMAGEVRGKLSETLNQMDVEGCIVEGLANYSL